jgi:hypothetical protein
MWIGALFPALLSEKLTITGVWTPAGRDRWKAVSRL